MLKGYMANLKTPSFDRSGGSKSFFQKSAKSSLPPICSTCLLLAVAMAGLIEEPTRISVVSVRSKATESTGTKE